MAIDVEYTSTRENDYLEPFVFPGKAYQVGGSSFTADDVINFIQTQYGVSTRYQYGDGLPLQSYTSYAISDIRSVCLRDAVVCLRPNSSIGKRVENIVFRLPLPDDVLLQGAYTVDKAGQVLEGGKYEIRAGAFLVYGANERSASPFGFIYFGLAPELTVPPLVKNDSSSGMVPDSSRLPFVKPVHYTVWASGFGYGDAIGYESYHIDPSNTTQIIQSSTLQMVFEAPFPFKDFQRGDQPVLTGGDDPLLSPYFLIMDTFADGVIDDHGAPHERVVPLTSAYYVENESGIKDMRRWLGEGDEEILARRRAFVEFLREKFNITIDPGALTSQEAAYPENEVAGITPYSAAHRSGLRIVSSSAPTEPSSVTRQIQNQRLIEVGFKYDSPGLGTIKQGVYIIENYRGEAQQSIYGAPIVPHIAFQTRAPSTVNEVFHSIISEDVFLTAASSSSSTRWDCSGVYLATSVQYPASRHSGQLAWRVR